MQPALFDSETRQETVSGPVRSGPARVDYVDTKQILTRPSGFLEFYDYSLNPFSGCTFGCTYCYAAFFSRDAGKSADWGNWLEVKRNAVRLLNRRKPGSLDGKRIYMSSVTDPYVPLERRLESTRRLLQVLADRHRPVLVVQTRSPLATRDIDLYRRIEERGGRVQVNMTVTTDDDGIRRVFEPLCPSVPRRLQAIAEIREAGVEAAVTLTPLLLSRNPRAFAETLLATGVRKFIADPFSFRSGRFVASTREPALELMARRLNCERKDLRREYLRRYSAFCEEFETRLHEAGLPQLLQGKTGFAPPGL